MQSYSMCDKNHCHEHSKQLRFAQLAEAHVVARLLIAITACAIFECATRRCMYSWAFLLTTPQSPE